MINASLIKLVWKPTEQRGEKLFWGTVKLFSCFDSEFADDRVVAAGENERKHTVTVARKTVNHVSHVTGRRVNMRRAHPRACFIRPRLMISITCSVKMRFAKSDKEIPSLTLNTKELMSSAGGSEFTR